MTDIIQIYDNDNKSTANIRVDKIQCLEVNPNNDTFDATLVSGLVYKNVSQQVYNKFIDYCGARLIHINNMFFVDAKRIQTLCCLEPDLPKNINDFQIEMILVSGWTFKASLGLNKHRYDEIEEIWRSSI